jgi:hypothetical protein
MLEEFLPHFSDVSAQTSGVACLGTVEENEPGLVVLNFGLLLVSDELLKEVRVQFHTTGGSQGLLGGQASHHD